MGRRLRRWIGACLTLVLSVLAPRTGSFAHAQFDLVRARGEVALPDLPEGFTRSVRGDVTWDHPSGDTATLDRLAAVRESEWPRIEADLGVDVDDGLVIRIARNPEEMRAMAPIGAPPPEYATGVAYPRWGVILVSLSAPRSSHSAPGVDEIFVHELSHVALRRAVNFAPMPRWFVEGVAIHHSRERSMERFRVLWSAHLAGDLLPLDMVERSFPHEQGAVSLAYAESADLVTFLRRQRDADTRFRSLIDQVEEGTPFDDAMLDAFALSPLQLEREWTQDLEERMSSVPLMVGGTTFWVLATLLLIWAWRKRRKRHARRTAEMGREEAERDAAIERLEAIVEMQLEQGEPRLIMSGDPPQGREPGVPTVEHDGHSHTLH